MEDIPQRIFENGIPEGMVSSRVEQGMSSIGVKRNGEVAESAIDGEMGS